MILQGKSAEKASRRYYVFAGSKADWREQIPLDCEIRRIDETLLERDRLGNIEQVIGWVQSFWRSNQDFASKGFGYCLIKEDAIVSWCLSVYMSGMDYELGIATIPEYRMGKSGNVGSRVLVLLTETTKKRGDQLQDHKDSAAEPRTEHEPDF